MNFQRLNKITKHFFITEGKGGEPDLFSYVQALKEMLSLLRPSTLKEKHTITICQEHLREIKKKTKRLVEENIALQEEINTLRNDK